MPLIKDYSKLNIWYTNFYLICQAWETKLVAVFPNALFRFYNIVGDFLYLCIILELTCINYYRLNITFVPITLTYCTSLLIIIFRLIKCYICLIYRMTQFLENLNEHNKKKKKKEEIERHETYIIFK